MTRPWEPLLHGAERDRALEIVAAIATATADEPNDWRGLMGSTGVAIFLAAAQADGLADELGILDALDHGVAELREGTARLGLWDGAAGMRWAVSQLTTGDDASALLTHLDLGIETRLSSPDCGGYDLYSGLSGVLISYADDAWRGDQILELVLDHFARIELFEPGQERLGCAHGIAGVLGALAYSHSHGRSDSRSEPLMLALIAALENADVSDQRIGWCRGEIGIAIALLSAARALGDNGLAERAIAVALAPHARDGGRWPVDACLCHGTAGLAHLYNRMYQATGNGTLGEYARIWLRKTIAMQVPGTGIAGFRMRRNGSQAAWAADTSLLVGASGVGLALLAGVTSTTPDWDRVLAADIALPEP